MFDLNILFVSVSAVAMLVLPVTGWFKSHVEFLGSVKTQTFSWVVAMLISFAGYWLKLGVFADASIVETILYGFAAGLTANGLATTEIVDAVLKAIKARL